MNILSKIKNNIPNVITCLNLLSGVLAIVNAFRAGDLVPTIFGCDMYGYQLAFLFIALGALFDFGDGLVARLLGSTTNLGKELDSLSDLVSFGVAPSLIMFNLYGHSSTGYAMLLIAVFAGVRLAKFNVDTRQTTSFCGLPVPANALFWIGYCEFLYRHTTLFVPEWVSIVLALLFSWLMISDIPMFSLKAKNFSFKDNWQRYLLIVASVVILLTAGIIGLAYIILFYLLLSLLFGNGQK